MKSCHLVFAFFLLLTSACTKVQIDPSLELTSTATASPTTAATAKPAATILSFVDSGQRLGAGRSWDVALGDLDGDGDLDAVVANDLRGELGSEVWLNDGQAVFTIKAQELGYGMGLDLGDMDGDGDLDVFIVGWDDVGQVWLNNGTGIFSDSGQSLGDPGGWDVVLGDLDGDGDLDAVIAHEKADTVWLNDGNANFNDSGQRLGSSYTAAVGLADLDGDGDLDAVTVGWDEPGKAWLNDGSGLFVDSGQELTHGYIHIHGMTLGDVTGNGLPDAIMAGAANQVWFNDRQGHLVNSEQNLTRAPGDTVAIGDLDGDGDLDAYLAVGQAGGAADKIWLNDGQGYFVDSNLSLSTGFSSGIGLGDLDSDGALDAFITHGELGQITGGGLPNEVWLNESR